MVDSLMSTMVPVLTLPDGLVGFPEASRFAIVELDALGMLYRLDCIEDTTLSFVAVAPHRYRPDYSPEIDEQTVADLKLDSADDVLLLALVTVGAKVEDAAVNLLAPIVVNRRSLRAAQVVLSGQDWPLRHPLRAG